MSTFRIPPRLLFYISGTGWGQGAEPVEDVARRTILAAIEMGANKDGSVSVDGTPEVLARLWFEADHLADGYIYGNKEPDSLADYNSARAVKRKVEDLLRNTRYRDVPFRELMYR